MEFHVILTETLACFLLRRAKDLSAHLYSDAKLLNLLVGGGYIEFNKNQKT